MLKKDANYKIIKDIPLRNGNVIKEGTGIYRIHGVYYLDSGMLPKDYQEDFDMLIEAESKRGWKYIAEFRDKVV